MLKRIIDRENDEMYYYDSILLKNNKTAMFRIDIIYCYDNYNSKVWNVAFAISNKKKHIKRWLNGESDILANTISGDGSLEGLIWAKNKLIEFEKIISENEYGTHRIIVEWEDNRRRNVYEKALSKIGYKMTIFDGRKLLLKTVYGRDIRND